MDARGFEHAVLSFKDRVHAYATRMLRDPAEGQDVAQDALVRLWQHRDAVDEPGAHLWLMRTAHNLCIDRLRRRKVRSEVAGGDEMMDVQRDDGPGPEDRAGASEIGRGIERALAGLGDLDRAVLLMREVHGMPYEEIASALGLPLGTLKARLHRARERLRTRLCRVGVTP
jgi:RNA polymerase sigma-70 factor (ECF subfamily)